MEARNPMRPATSGNIPEVIRNSNIVYQGDLIPYFGILFGKARNLRCPYHNARHILHVTYQCYIACVSYGHKLTKREMRNLLIAAMFHDFDHSGLTGDDDLNIARALRALQKFILPEDQSHRDEIEYLIKATEYPYKIDA